MNRAGIANAVEFGVGIAATGEEIHVTVGAEAHRGDVERITVQEFFLGAGVAGAFFLKIDGVKSSEGPVADEEFVLINRGEIGVVPEADAGR